MFSSLHLEVKWRNVCNGYSIDVSFRMFCSKWFLLMKIIIIGYYLLKHPVFLGPRTASLPRQIVSRTRNEFQKVGWLLFLSLLSFFRATHFQFFQLGLWIGNNCLPPYFLKKLHHYFLIKKTKQKLINVKNYDYEEFKFF